MRRILTVTCAAAVALALTAGSAAADRTQAKNYEAIPATCAELGEVVIEVVNLGHWGTGSVQGTQTTLIPRYFDFSATDLSTGEVLFAELVTKRTSEVDDVCSFSFIEEIPEGDPFLPEGGTVLFEAEVGVKVVGR